MSVSENSTLLPVAREHEGSYQLMDGEAYGVGDLAVNSYKKSPYTDSEIISLEVGPSQTRFRVHRIILSQSPELDSMLQWNIWGGKTNDTISLPELDETTAHTLVHYLYTGKYQALKPNEEGKEGVIPEYKLGTCVYCAATRYELPGLAELAKEKITAFGEDLTILDILGVARENAFPGLPDDELWFPAYLEDAIQGAVSEDPGLFMKPGFVDQIEGDRKFRQVVMKAIVNTYSRGPTVIDQRKAGRSTSVSEPRLEEPTQADAQEPENSESEPIESQIIPPEETAIAAEVIQEDAVERDVDTSAVESPLAPEPFTDELHFETSKKNQTPGKKTENPVDAEVVVDSKPLTPAHTRSDSVTQVTETVPTEPSPVVDEKLSTTSPEATDAVPTVVDGATSNVATTAKKSRKKNKKKNSVVASQSV